MGSNLLTDHIGQRISLPGHFDVPVVLEDARPLARGSCNYLAKSFDARIKRAQQLAETYWLYVVWDPLGDSPELVRIHNPATTLDHAKREIVAARFFEIPAEAVIMAADEGTRQSDKER